jgi:hypothetical protein
MAVIQRAGRGTPGQGSRPANLNTSGLVSFLPQQGRAQRDIEEQRAEDRRKEDRRRKEEREEEVAARKAEILKQKAKEKKEKNAARMKKVKEAKLKQPRHTYVVGGMIYTNPFTTND